MFVDQDSPAVSEDWKQLSPAERCQRLNNALIEFHSKVSFTLVDAMSNGQVFLSFETTPSVSERGALLLDLEEYLKARVDAGITVWVNPLGDRSALRKLRGVNIQKIKSEN